jgi:uncharacterized RDD family membrane protein YckC
MVENTEEIVYATFKRRFWAHAIDVSILFVIFVIPLFMGAQFVLNPTTFLQWVGFVSFKYVFPLIATITFWRLYNGTPGKLMLKIEILDEKTFQPLGYKQSVIRYFAYIPAMLPLFAGFFWVLKSNRNQGWHDLLAKSVVLKK